MTEFRRLLPAAAALTVILAGGQATAQTVVVIKAPAGTTVELGLNAATIGTATASASAVVSLPVNLEAHGRKPAADVRIFVDVCEKSRRVTLLETGWEPPPAGAGCARHEIFGVYFLQKVTTVVVNASVEAQAVWIKQGAAPDAWLRDLPPETEKAASVSDAFIPRGFTLFAGGGMSRYAKASTVSCGVYTSCASNNTKANIWIGGDFWFRPWVAASAGYLKPWAATADGSGNGYRFNTTLNPNVVTITGKVGAPLGRARLYGEAGAAYNWTSRTTTQTMDDKNLVVDGLPVTIPGGTQVFTLNTEGWNWVYGGGGEFWLTRIVAVWGEVSWVKLTGKASGGSEGSLKDTLTSITGGVRLRLGRN